MTSVTKPGRQSLPPTPAVVAVLATTLAMAGAARVPAAAATTDAGLAVAPRAVATCPHQAGGALRCDVRTVPAGPVSGVAVRLRDLPLPSTPPLPHPPRLQDAAVLLLVDSGPAGARSRADGVLQALTAGIGEGLRVGLASFDTRLEVLAPVGSSADELDRAVAALPARDGPTELFRMVLLGIRHVASLPARQRAVYVVSDGVADDRAYFFRDVAEAAREAGVVIVGIGYGDQGQGDGQDDGGGALALQTLRRLAEETGGILHLAGAESARERLSQDPYAPLLGGYAFRVDVTAATDRGLTGPARLDLEVLTPDGALATSVTTRIAQPAAGASLAPAPPAAAATPAAPSAPGPRLGAALLWVAGAALVAGGLGVLIRRRWWPAAPPVPPPGAQPSPRAFFELTGDPDHPPIALDEAEIRIGRSADNEVRLEDNSVSRHHARLQRGPDGHYTIHDLHSLNGVYVNDRPVQSAPLQDGDRVEIGDLALRYRAGAGPGRTGLERTLISRSPGRGGQ